MDISMSLKWIWCDIIMNDLQRISDAVLDISTKVNTVYALGIAK